MSSVVIGMIDALGAMFFLLAFRWGIHNFMQESDISEFWVAYSMAMFAGFLFAMTKAIEWFGVSVRLANLIQPFLAIIVGTILLVTSVVCVVSPIHRIVK